MTHPNDDFDDRLRRAAREYNRPGEPPRERMWAEIRSRRARQRIVATPPSTWRRRGWYAPAAAAAVLVLGIAIGRVYEHARTDVSRRTAHRVDSPNAATLARGSDSTTKAESLATLLTSVPESAVAVAPSIHRAPRIETVPTDSARSSRAYAPSSANMAYRLAVVEHLAGTEAMLSSFRAAAKRGEVDAQITNWARNLLTTTRLLQASAAQEDPTMKRLLDDLELVLVQIAQYTSASPHRAEELELIEHSIERRGVIGKLHTTIPARLGPAGT
jgi:hypothetical protein